MKVMRPHINRSKIEHANGTQGRQIVIEVSTQKSIVRLASPLDYRSRVLPTSLVKARILS